METGGVLCVRICAYGCSFIYVNLCNLLCLGHTADISPFMLFMFHSRATLEFISPFSYWSLIERSLIISYWDFPPSLPKILEKGFANLHTHALIFKGLISKAEVAETKWAMCVFFIWINIAKLFKKKTTLFQYTFPLEACIHFSPSSPRTG